jgi:hypothetical protein
MQHLFSLRFAVYKVCFSGFTPSDLVFMRNPIFPRKLFSPILSLSFPFQSAVAARLFIGPANDSNTEWNKLLNLKLVN